MLENFNIRMADVFPVCVIATMSSGKSTFINALLGEEILPEKNEACTARVMAIADNERAITSKAYIIKQDGSKGYVEIDQRGVLEKINADENVKDVLIEMNIPVIHNSFKPLVLFDTPGVNNSDDIRHAERTQEILQQLDHGAIIYLMNATQLATNDDALLLQMVSEHIKKHPKVDICFVLNKIDMLDEDKESIEGIINNARDYIKEFGFDKANIYPISALSAKVLRLKQNNKYMTKNEERRLNDAYKEYRAVEKNMLQYASIYGLSDASYVIDDTLVSKYEIKRAIENTGIIGVEKQIIAFVYKTIYKPCTSIINGKGYVEWEGIYSKRKKSKNFKNYSGKVKWICKKCRQVNGDNDSCLNCAGHNIIWDVKYQ